MERPHRPHHQLHRPIEGPRAASAVRRVFIITLFLNLSVAAAKAGYGYLSGSIALGADAVHAGLDASSNVLALMSLHWSQAPADAGHPYGHRKIEILAALGIGVLIVIGLFELGLAAVTSLFGNARPPRIGWSGFVVVGCTMLVNYFITRYEENRGHSLGSSILCADAQHTRSDLYASAAVLLSFIGVHLGWAWADPLGAICVVAMVGRAAWMVFRDNVPTLIDAAVLDPERMTEMALQVPGVVAVPHVRSRGLRNDVHVEMRIAVAADLSVHGANEISEQVESTLRRGFPEISDVSIRPIPMRGTKT